MVIGILTQPLHNNYGGLLQAYALQKTLEKLGHDAIVINRDKPIQGVTKRLLKICKALLCKFFFNNRGIEIIQFIPNENQEKIISKNTSLFIKEEISTTELLLSTSELRKHIKKNRYDALVVGSDQVWRPKYSPCITDYYLGFLECNSPVRRVAYAASFGVNNWEYTQEQKCECAELAQHFDTISVREKTAIELCHKYLNVDSCHVLDPTLLLDIDDYRFLASRKKEPESSGEILTYILDKSDHKKSIIAKVASVTGLTPFSVTPKLYLTKDTEGKIENCIFPRVTQWLQGFIDAKFVVTDSFHGCVFSILFNIPFIVIGNKDRGLARFTSLLDLFQLRGRLLVSEEAHYDDLIVNDIDWSNVNLRHKELKELSLKFLQNSLS